MTLLLHVEDGRGGYLHVEEGPHDTVIISTEESAGGECKLDAADVTMLLQVLGGWLLARPENSAQLAPPPGEDE